MLNLAVLAGPTGEVWRALGKSGEILVNGILVAYLQLFLCHTKLTHCNFQLSVHHAWCLITTFSSLLIGNTNTLSM